MIARLSRLLVVALFLCVGVWLLSRSVNMQVEGPARQRAMAALAPAGAQLRQVSLLPSLEGESGAPATVNLADVPAGVYDPNNQYDRWQRGEIDLDENESIVDEARMAELQAEALQLPASEDINLAGSGGVLAPSAGIAFDSIDINDCCGGGANVPPDPEMAAGPNHLIAVVNVAFEIYDKSGNSLAGPLTFASFMSSNPGCTGVFDPNVLYDESADRFLLGIDADGAGYCLAVSQTGDPLGSWWVYFFPTGSNFFDYPHAGVGNDAIYMGGNIFSCTFFGCSFLESRVWAFEKADLYTGQSASFISRPLAFSEDTPQPLNLHGWNQGTWPAGGPHYFFTETDYNGRTYSVHSWNDPFGANTFGLVGTVDLQAYTGVTAGFPLDTPQSGGQTIQANDFRPQDFEYRDGYGWSVQTISCNPGGGSVNCIRWVQIDPATATIVDAGVYASAAEYRIFGDLAVDACGNMAVGYTKSSNNMFPSIWYTGRLSTDPAGQLQTEAQLKAGEITYTAFDPAPRRWGDYTGMTIDPDGTTFWYLGEYSKVTGNANGRWGTYIGSMTYNCDPGGGNPTPTPMPPTPTPDPNATVHVGDLDGSSALGPGNRWTAIVNVTVHDGSDNPLAGANVSGNWSNGTSGSGSCVTDAAGQCTIASGYIRTTVSSVVFTVSNVSASGYTYDAASNHDPDGDSDGTAITVFQDGPPPPTPTPPPPTPTPQPGATVHVGDLDGSGQSISPSRWSATVVITVHDDSDNPIVGATVNGSWSNGASGSGSCVTDSAGQCSITHSSIRTTQPSATFTVSNVSASGYTYDAGDNHDPDGDSDGTEIVILQP